MQPPPFFTLRHSYKCRLVQPAMVPAPTCAFASGTNEEVHRLIERLSPAVVSVLATMEARDGQSLLDSLVELNVQQGRRPEVVLADKKGATRRQFLSDLPCTVHDVQLFAPFFQELTTHKRAGLPGTLHRLSFTTHPLKNDVPIAVTARVGRSLEGVVSRMAPFLLKSTDSLLLIGCPSKGTTTLLRDLARMLSSDLSLTVCVVYKTCELAGDDLQPHEAIGSARWMPVGKSGLQASILRECVENQAPDVISVCVWCRAHAWLDACAFINAVCDEISTPEEVEAARTIAQRGVRLIASVHGSTLPEIVNDSGVSSVVVAPNI